MIGLAAVEADRLGPAASLAKLVAHSVLDGGPQVRLQRARAADFEVVEALEGAKERVLDEVVGIGCVARPLRQPAPGPSAERSEMPLHQALQRVRIARTGAVDQSKGRFEIVRSIAGRHERIGAVISHRQKCGGRFYLKGVTAAVTAGAYVSAVQK